MFARMREKVSKKKRRYQQDGFDLDLTYITERIIVMGFPCEGIQQYYRNSMTEIQRFFETKHPGHYKVYNLCAEEDRQYSPDKFHGRAERFPFYDHMAPPIELIRPFCESVRSWLMEDEKNVVAIHCKAGKGRAGTMTCCLLCHLGNFEDPDQAMTYYGNTRTHDGKGVTIQSQKRYTRWYADRLKSGAKPAVDRVVLQLVLSIDGSLIDMDSDDLQLTIKNGDRKYSALVQGQRRCDFANNIVTFLFPSTTIVNGDVLFQFYRRHTHKRIRTFRFWLHTGHSSNVVILEGNEMDDFRKEAQKHLLGPQTTATLTWYVPGAHATLP